MLLKWKMVIPTDLREKKKEKKKTGDRMKDNKIPKKEYRKYAYIANTWIPNKLYHYNHIKYRHSSPHKQ